MCERDRKFVAPIRPGAGMGWWIGQIAGGGMPVRKMSGEEVTLYEVAVLWMQNPEYKGSDVMHSSGPLREFATAQEAMDFLKSQGVLVSPL